MLQHRRGHRSLVEHSRLLLIKIQSFTSGSGSSGRVVYGVHVTRWRMIMLTLMCTLMAYVLLSLSWSRCWCSPNGFHRPSLLTRIVCCTPQHIPKVNLTRIIHPAETLARESAATNFSQLIPLTIWQTYNSRALVPAVHRAVTNWMNLNPEFTHRLVDDEEAASLIDHHLPMYSDVYHHITIGAVKGDFIRVVLLYLFGGVYFDIDSVCNRAIRHWNIHHHTEIVLSKRGDDGYIQWGMLVTPRHEVMRRYLVSMVDNLRVASLGTRKADIFSLSGPHLYDRVIRQWLSESDTTADKRKNLPSTIINVDVVDESVLDDVDEASANDVTRQQQQPPSTIAASTVRVTPAIPNDSNKRSSPSVWTMGFEFSGYASAYTQEIINERRRTDEVHWSWNNQIM
jgi:mannosyltransferase OCH1-like enzyme